ncbi:MAG: polysaccharide deacetylase family protein [Alphaproteobacteria bacterium]|nr:polysaccharide deacetylase family protein [Alphaproteobacteria bacterium]
MGLAEALGIGRGVILHVDDLAMCNGGNRAYLDLAARGLVTCGSVMVPCPWFGEIAEAAAADPTLDLGVHLTLTSEWRHYRWRPLTTASPASGLIDEEGCFWRDIESLRAHLVPEAAEIELRAQIERAFAAGLRVTHIDAHMAAAMLPELLELHIRLARDYEVVPVLPRAIRWAPDRDCYREAVDALDMAGLPVIDHFRGTLPVAAEEVAAGYRETIAGLPEGITHFALHATVPGEIAAISPQHAPWRTNEYALFASGTVAECCAAAGISPIGYRQIQCLWQERQHGSADIQRHPRPKIAIPNS